MNPPHFQVNPPSIFSWNLQKNWCHVSTSTNKSTCVSSGSKSHLQIYALERKRWLGATGGIQENDSESWRSEFFVAKSKAKSSKILKIRMSWGKGNKPFLKTPARLVWKRIWTCSNVQRFLQINYFINWWHSHFSNQGIRNHGVFPTNLDLSL